MLFCVGIPHYIASKLSNDSLEQDVIERELFAAKQWQKLDQGLLTVEEALKELKTDNPQLIRQRHYCIGMIILSLLLKW